MFAAPQSVRSHSSTGNTRPALKTSTGFAGQHISSQSPNQNLTQTSFYNTQRMGFMGGPQRNQMRAQTQLMANERH